jgi:hypothetical protein
MNSELTPLRLDPSPKNAAKTFSVVGIYQGISAAPRMQAARDQLVRILCAEVQLNFFSWPFHKLESPDIRSMALHIAEEAGIILIAGTGAECMPEHVLRWLDSCIIAQQGRRALIVALEPNRNLGAFAQQFAMRWQTQCLCAEDLEHGPNRSMIIHAVQRHLELDEAEEKAIRQWIEANTTHPASSVNRPARILPSLTNKPEFREEIRMIAYQLWLAAGRPSGGELDFWLQAERDFMSQQATECSSADC